MLYRYDNYGFSIPVVLDYADTGYFRRDQHEDETQNALLALGALLKVPAAFIASLIRRVLSLPARRILL